MGRKTGREKVMQEVLNDMNNLDNRAINYIFDQYESFKSYSVNYEALWNHLKYNLNKVIEEYETNRKVKLKTKKEK